MGIFSFHPTCFDYLAQNRTCKKRKRSESKEAQQESEWDEDMERYFTPMGEEMGRGGNYFSLLSSLVFVQ